MRRPAKGRREIELAWLPESSFTPPDAVQRPGTFADYRLSSCGSSTPLLRPRAAWARRPSAISRTPDPLPASSVDIGRLDRDRRRAAPGLHTRPRAAPGVQRPVAGSFHYG